MTTIDVSTTDVRTAAGGAAVLDDAHLGDIHGALGSIDQHDTGERRGMSRKLKTLLAIVGPGLIVMVGDNDAGAFSTYAQAGQNYGTTLLWTLLLLVPVLYVNQEMVLRLGAVTGVGHARLILERFGRFWGAFSVIDLFLLNALTLVTEFIGISVGLDYLGVPKVWGVLAAAAVIVGAAGTGSFRRFERVCVALCVASLLLVPIFLLVHPPLDRLGHDLLVPRLPGGDLGDVMLLVIGIVGTTVAPWQLFFQQSFVIDKRITPRFIGYQKADLWIGIVVVLLGAIAMIGFTAQAVAGSAEAGSFTDVTGVAQALTTHGGRVAGVLFAIALIDASVIGACAVSLSTAYAIGDVFAIRHSLHRRPNQAKGFYAVFVGLVGVSAALVLLPGVPLGVITNAVQTLAGVLLPSATVFLLLLCNDKQVLGPWVNGRWTNAFTSAVIGLLVLLSVILVGSVMCRLTGEDIGAILFGGTAVGALAGVAALLRARRGGRPAPIDRTGRESWRMPPLATLTTPTLSTGRRFGLGALRAYLVVATIGVVVRVVHLAATT